MLKKLNKLGLIALLVSLVGGAAVMAVDHFEPAPQQAQQAAKDRSQLDAFNVLASERVAYYTKVLAIFTGVLMGVSAIQIWFLIKADQRAAQAATAAGEQIALARQAYVAEHRTTMEVSAHIEAVEVLEGGAIRVVIIVTAKNTGGRPATHVRLRAIPCRGRGFCISPDEVAAFIDKEKRASNTSPNGGVAVPAGESYDTRVTSTAETVPSLEAKADQQAVGDFLPKLPTTLSVACFVIYKCLVSDEWFHTGQIIVLTAPEEFDKPGRIPVKSTRLPGNIMS